MIPANDRWHDSEWINRMNSEHLLKAIESNIAYNGSECKKFRERHPLKFREHLKKYEKTEKAKSLRKKQQECRRLLYSRKNNPLSMEEMEMMRDFYGSCPRGYCVDHIHPLSKNGKHELSNLQHIKISYNSHKRDKIVLKENGYPRCPVNILLAIESPV